MFSGIFVNYVYFKYLLLTYRLPFYFLNYIFWWKSVGLNYIFWWKSVGLIFNAVKCTHCFSYCLGLFVSCLKNLCSLQDHEDNILYPIDVILCCLSYSSLQSTWNCWAPMTHACNPSYLGDWDREDCSLRPARTNSSQNSISKKIK
jgi:hypothetical protein